MCSAAFRNPDDASKRRPNKTEQTRHLRQSEAEKEHRLWSDLRNRLLNGHKFTRQIPLGPYIVDFLCRDRHLIIEIDGFHHAEAPTDERRTRWLNERGYMVLRFWNHEVTREHEAVLETIVAALEGRLVDRDEVARFYPAISQSGMEGGR
jgi:very-short-patch-repair endonuclease